MPRRCLSRNAARKGDAGLSNSVSRACGETEFRGQVRSQTEFGNESKPAPSFCRSFSVALFSIRVIPESFRGSFLTPRRLRTAPKHLIRALYETPLVVGSSRCIFRRSAIPRSGGG